MIRRPPRSTRTDTLFPYTTLFRSARKWVALRRSSVEPGNQNFSGWLSSYTPMTTGPVMEPPRADGPGHGVPSVRTSLGRSEEHTSELQSLMRISYAVFCLKKKKTKRTERNHKERMNKIKMHR